MVFRIPTVTKKFWTLVSFAQVNMRTFAFLKSFVKTEDEASALHMLTHWSQSRQERRIQDNQLDQQTIK